MNEAETIEALSETIRRIHETKFFGSATNANPDETFDMAAFLKLAKRLEEDAKNAPFQMREIIPDESEYVVKCDGKYYMSKRLFGEFNRTFDKVAWFAGRQILNLDHPIIGDGWGKLLRGAK